MTGKNHLYEEAVRVAAAKFAEHVSSLADDAYFREAVLKMAVREVTWALHQQFANEGVALQEQLALMGELVEEEENR